MQEVIDLLLQKQATLETDKEAEKALACEQIEKDYAERSDKIEKLLEMAGYEKPVEEPASEPVEEVTSDAESPAENTQNAY